MIVRTHGANDPTPLIILLTGKMAQSKMFKADTGESTAVNWLEIYAGKFPEFMSHHVWEFLEIQDQVRASACSKGTIGKKPALARAFADAPMLDMTRVSERMALDSWLAVSEWPRQRPAHDVRRLFVQTLLKRKNPGALHVVAAAGIECFGELEMGMLVLLVAKGAEIDVRACPNVTHAAWESLAQTGARVNTGLCWQVTQPGVYDANAHDVAMSLVLAAAHAGKNQEATQRVLESCAHRKPIDNRQRQMMISVDDTPTAADFLQMRHWDTWIEHVYGDLLLNDSPTSGSLRNICAMTVWGSVRPDAHGSDRAELVVRVVQLLHAFEVPVEDGRTGRYTRVDEREDGRLVVHARLHVVCERVYPSMWLPRAWRVMAICPGRRSQRPALPGPLICSCTLPGQPVPSQYSETRIVDGLTQDA